MTGGKEYDCSSDYLKQLIMKTYTLLISKTFLNGHRKEGDPTDFIGKIIAGVKIHTIRRNYEFWLNRANEINSGRAVLSLRFWSGKPYCSKQIKIMELNKISVQKLDGRNTEYAIVDGKKVPWELIARNDGLSLDDFKDWFKGYTKNALAIIQFTDFKY
jgi:hypothetical protein